MTHLDWKGREIKVGSIVKHRYECLDRKANIGLLRETDPDALNGFHEFGGSAPVIRLHEWTVEVRPTSRNQVPVYMPCMLEVVG